MLKEERYRFLSVHRPFLSVGAIGCLHNKGPCKMKPETQVKTPEKTHGKLGENPDVARPWTVWETKMWLKNVRQKRGSKGKLIGQQMISTANLTFSFFSHHFWKTLLIRVDDYEASCQLLKKTWSYKAKVLNLCSYNTSFLGIWTRLSSQLGCLAQGQYECVLCGLGKVSLHHCSKMKWHSFSA